VGRRSKYSSDLILDAAELLLADDGPAALSITRLADRLGAPSGSIYYRFGSRDLLVASLWLRAIQRFQDSLSAALDEPDPQRAARLMARQVLDWTRQNTVSAQLLMLHRSVDLLDGDWPADLAAQNLAQRRRVEQMIDDLCKRLGVPGAAERRRVVFAVIDIPYAAVRSSLSDGNAPSAELDEIVDDAVVAVLNPLKLPKGHS